MTAGGESLTPAGGAVIGDGAVSGGRARWWVAGSFLALVAAGVLSGVALDRLVLSPRMGAGMGGGRGGHGGAGGMPPFGDTRGGRGGGWGRGGPPDSVRRKMRDRFAEEFGLSATQRGQIDSLMTRQEPKFRALREKFAPAMDSITHETQTEMDKILTLEQREKMKAARERMRERRPGEPRRP